VLKRALKVSAHRVSMSAREKIEAAGGKVELLASLERVRTKAPVEQPKEGEVPAEKAETAPPAKAKGRAVQAAKEPAAKTESKAAKPEAAPHKAAKAKPSQAAKPKSGGEAKKK
jgi:hypothetical protein